MSWSTASCGDRRPSVHSAQIFGEFYPNPGVGLAVAVPTWVAVVAEATGTFALVFMILVLTEGCNLGRPGHRTITRQPLAIHNPDIQAKIVLTDFYSVTVRAFRLDDLEDICKDYGQVAVYRGTLPDHPHFFDLDDHHRLETVKPMLVCGNTASMLANTRFSAHFVVQGNRDIHYGPFDCGPSDGTAAEGECGSACC